MHRSQSVTQQPPEPQPPDIPPQGSQGFDETHCVWQQPTDVTNSNPLRQIRRCRFMGSLSLNVRSVRHLRRNLFPLRIDRHSPQTLRILPVFLKTSRTTIVMCVQPTSNMPVMTISPASLTHQFLDVQNDPKDVGGQWIAEINPHILPASWHGSNSVRRAAPVR